MRKLVLFGLVAATLLLAGPAFAFRVPEANAPYPTPHQQDVRYADSQEQPWRQTYSDEAARRMGVADGTWQAFGTPVGESARFSLKGGLGSRGAVLRLQW
jgi:hypothetical protein